MIPKHMDSFSFSLLLKNRAEASPFLYFYLFITVTLAAFTFLGQMLVTLFKDTITAQGFGSLIVVSSSFFGGAFGQQLP
jgi:preprotein translocase subunit SecY